jgi:RNA polymerase sigma-70 factor (ECF subfamily)
MPDDASAPPHDVAALTARMARGDEAAYREFHEIYFPRLLRYLLVVSGGREEAAREALQATLLRVVRYIRRFEREDVLWSWLTVLARSALVDEERRQFRYRSLLDRFFRRAEPAPSLAGDEADGELFSLLQENLAALSADDRALLERKYFAREPVKLIAGATGVTEKSVESRLVRIRRQLRQNMLAQLNDETAR